MLVLKKKLNKAVRFVFVQEYQMYRAPPLQAHQSKAAMIQQLNNRKQVSIHIDIDINSKETMIHQLNNRKQVVYT